MGGEEDPLQEAFATLLIKTATKKRQISTQIFF